MSGSFDESTESIRPGVSLAWRWPEPPERRGLWILFGLHALYGLYVSIGTGSLFALCPVLVSGVTLLLLPVWVGARSPEHRPFARALVRPWYSLSVFLSALHHLILVGVAPVPLAADLILAAAVLGTTGGTLLSATLTPPERASSLAISLVVLAGSAWAHFGAVATIAIDRDAASVPLFVLAGGSCLLVWLRPLGALWFFLPARWCGGPFDPALWWIPPSTFATLEAAQLRSSWRTRLILNRQLVSGIGRGGHFALILAQGADRSARIAEGLLALRWLAPRSSSLAARLAARLARPGLPEPGSALMPDVRLVRTADLLQRGLARCAARVQDDPAQGWEELGRLLACGLGSMDLWPVHVRGISSGFGAIRHMLEMTRDKMKEAALEGGQGRPRIESLIDELGRGIRKIPSSFNSLTQ